MNFQKLLVLVLACAITAMPTTIYTSTDVPKTTDPTSLTSIIDVPDSLLLTDVNVTLNMDVFFGENMDMFLTSPSGTEVQLFNENCGANENIVMTFDDEAAQGLGACGDTNAASGLAFQPFQALSAFDGQDAFGVWTFRAVDTFGSTGDATLRSLSLELSGSSAPPIPEPATFGAAALGLLSLAAIGYRRRRRQDK